MPIGSISIAISSIGVLNKTIYTATESKTDSECIVAPQPVCGSNNVSTVCACPWRGRELVSVLCDVCGERGLSRSEQLVGYFYSAPPLPSGLALTGAVRCSSQRPAKSVYFSHASVANTMTLLGQGVCNGHDL